MHKVALRIEVEPPLPADLRLEAGQVRHSDEDPAAGNEPAPHPLEHVPENGSVERVPGQLHLLEALVQNGDPRSVRHVAERLDGSDPVPRAGERNGEASVTRAEVDDARVVIERPEEPQLLADTQRQSHLERSREPALLGLGVEIRRAHRRICRYR